MANYESYKVGDSEFDFISFPLIATRHAYAYSDLPLTIPVNTGYLIMGVGSEVSTVFAGGTPTISVGDGSNATYWLTTTQCAATATGFVHSLGGGKGVLTGTVADKVVVTGSTQLTSGNGVLYIFSMDLNTNWRTSGQW